MLKKKYMKFKISWKALPKSKILPNSGTTSWSEVWKWWCYVVKIYFIILFGWCCFMYIFFLFFNIYFQNECILLLCLLSLCACYYCWWLQNGIFWEFWMAEHWTESNKVFSFQFFNDLYLHKFNFWGNQISRSFIWLAKDLYGFKFVLGFCLQYILYYL